MIVYLDTSAIVPILIAEASSDICREIWEGASRRASLRLTYIETAAALSMAERRQRITPEEHDRAWANFLAIWPDVDVIDLTKELADSAAQLARSQSLRGFDAAHCAAAAALSDSELVAVTGDAALLAAWRSLGVTVLDVNLRNLSDH